MNSNRLVVWIRDRKAEVRQALAAATSEPTPTSSPEWYAGLAVSPASFSRQLGDMQLSLMRANETRDSESHRHREGYTQTGDEIAVSQQRA